MEGKQTSSLFLFGGKTWYHNKGLFWLLGPLLCTPWTDTANINLLNRKYINIYCVIPMHKNILSRIILIKVRWKKFSFWQNWGSIIPLIVLIFTLYAVCVMQYIQKQNINCNLLKGYLSVWITGLYNIENISLELFREKTFQFQYNSGTIEKNRDSNFSHWIENNKLHFDSV